MEEEQLDQREQKHREEEQLQMLPRGFVDGREQPDDAVLIRPFIGEMQQHSEDGDEEKTDGVGDRKSTRLNSSHRCTSRMPSSA